MRELNIAEEKQDSILSAVILKECQIINNKIEDLKIVVYRLVHDL